MKWKKQFCVIFMVSSLILFSQSQLFGSTNSTPSAQESWGDISNRWGAVSFDKIQQTAEHNDVSAEYYLAVAYSEGIGVMKDENAAFKWMQLAAVQGRPQAQRKLGWMFESGAGTATNLDKAVEWFGKAAQQSDAQAQMNLGWMYENGVGVSQDYTNAAKFYRQAAEQGDSMAQNNLGWLLKNGRGVPQNQSEAIKWFQKAAEGGEPLGAENLAWIYFYGNDIKADYELAEKWMQQAVDTNSAEGQYKMGDFVKQVAYRDGNQTNAKFFRAAEWLRKSADRGDTKAEYELGELYNAGQLGNDQRSNCIPWYLKAAANGNVEAQAEIPKLPQYYPNNELLKSVNPIDSLRKAAEQDDLNAQFDLAWHYHHGDGVPKDDAKAFKWMEKAAQHEMSPVTRTSDAHYYLGVMYENGEGVMTNLAKARELYQRAATGGNKPDPILRLGQMYEKGEGVPKDDQQAAENYLLATQFGFFPTSDDTARGTAIESLFNLYLHGRGLPDDKAVIGQQLNAIKQTPIMTATGQFLLGEIYYQGKLVSQDLVEADVWYKLAANQNYSEAVNGLQQVESEMSSAQKDAAKFRFAEVDGRINQSGLLYKQADNIRRANVW